MTPLKDDRFLRALLREPVDVTPVCGPKLRRLIADSIQILDADGSRA
jgi:hypothetical protein